MKRLIPVLMTLLAASPAYAQDATPASAEPLAGWSDGTMFLRSPDNLFQLFPNGRLQVDGYFFKRDDLPMGSPAGSRMPTDTILLRRARIEMFGWIGKWFGFNIAGDFALGAPAGADPVAQSWIATTDDYIVLAPFNFTPNENAVIVQVGQFDAPFTLENRTSDKYFDFMERSITVRSFGIPDNKEVGAMVNGLVADKAVYYSVGLFNGDNQNFRNVDNAADVMGRAWIAPLRFAHFAPLENAEVGGSFWVGKRGGNGSILNTFSTQGGFAFTSSKGSFGMAKTPMELHQHGDLTEYAIEADIPISHKYGLRYEYVHKNQDLDIDDATSASTGKLIINGHAKLDGWSMYGEAWVWLVGDDTIIGAPGLQLPPRYKKFGSKPPVHGVMLTARLERLDMHITSPEMNFGVGSVGTSSANDETAITSSELGVNYWYSKRFRATFNYVWNRLDGNTAAYKSARNTNGGNDDEHEFLFRLAVAL